MASRGHNPVDLAGLTEGQLVPAHFTGAAAADMALVSGDIASATRTATGEFDLVFRNKYPQGIMPFKPGIVGTTTGLDAILTAWSPQAGTAHIKFSVGSVATDPAATDAVYLLFLVRNSGRNPSSW